MITWLKTSSSAVQFSYWHSVNIKVSTADTHPFVPGIVTISDVSHRPGRVQRSRIFYQRPVKTWIQSLCSCFMCQLQCRGPQIRTASWLLLLHSIKTKSKSSLVVFLLWKQIQSGKAVSSPLPGYVNLQCSWTLVTLAIFFSRSEDS